MSKNLQNQLNEEDILHLQSLKRQKQYRNPCSRTEKIWPIYGDRVNFFKNADVSE